MYEYVYVHIWLGRESGCIVEDECIMEMGK